ncbi:MAG: replicative DNA helicase [Rhizobiaceae bacterium]|nr:replicative DNA helicase [Rhizobiaceae bacterium]
MVEAVSRIGQAPGPANQAGNAQDASYRTAPHNIEVEQALLGAILVNNDAFFRVSDFLLPNHFFEPLHQNIYKVASDMIRATKTANPVTIKTFLPADDKVGDITVAQYLARLASEATTIINAEDYGQSIYDLSTRRYLISIGEDMVNIAFDAPVDLPPVSQIEDAERRLYELAENGRSDSGFHDFGSAMNSALDMAAAAYQRDGGLSGISTGLASLDQMMGGLQPSDLIVLAGRPAMGKTSLVTNIATNVAMAYRGDVEADGSPKSMEGGVVGFFSLEMSAEQLATRIVSEQSEISSSKIRRGEISEADFTKLTICSNMIQKIPLYIDDTGGISIAQLAARARRLKRQKGLDVLIIDYIQLMQGSSKNQGNRVQEITEITTGLKALGKELNVPIIALSQLSRQVESRDDKRPQLSDLRESGSIEQDADVVLFVYREEYYIQNKEPKEGTEEWFKWDEQLRLSRGKAEVIIGKQRHGPTGTARMAFQAEFTRFTDLVEDDHIPERFD